MIRIFSKIISKYLFYLSGLILIPLIVAFYYQFFSRAHPQPHTTLAFGITLIICLLVASFLYFYGKKAKEELYQRESIFIVVLVWVLSALLCSLPFSISQTLTPLDAYFEAMSGLTTTGATVICPKAYSPETGAEILLQHTNTRVPDKTYSFYGTVAPIRNPETGQIEKTGIEAVSKAILLWRSLLQWVGGMGIVVIFLAVLPVIGVGGKYLYRMESTGSAEDEVSPRIHDTATKLWKLYSAFTILQVMLFKITTPSMPFFDAINLSLTSISTGGFTVRNNGVESYPFITQAIIMIFIVLGSINFALYFQLIRRKFTKVYVPDLILFLCVALIGSVAVSTFLIPELGFFTALKEGFFQALSFQTTAGFYSTNYDLWPFSAQMIMILLMFIGGMSGSTSGGIKTFRFYIIYKILIHRLESIFRPDTVRKLYVGKKEIDDKNALTILVFFCLVAFFVIAGGTIFIFDGVDPETSIGLISCLLNNVGVAFRSVGPTESMAFLSPISKILAIVWMLLGRLEFFVVLLLFLPSFWKNT